MEKTSIIVNKLEKYSDERLVRKKATIMGGDTKRQISYTKSDQGPFKVNFRIKNSQNAAEKVNISVLSLAQTLSKNGYNDVVEYDKNSRRAITAHFMTIESANKSTSDTALTDKYDVFIPSSFVFVSGYIFAENGVERYDEEYGLLPRIKSDNDNIDSVKELKYTDSEGKQRNSAKIAISFRLRQLPSHIEAFNSILKVFPFINKVKQCKKCMRFGHIEVDCKSSKPRCPTCGADDHDKCEKIHCILCKSDDHSANDINCPALLKEKKIARVMSTNNIGYHEAKKQISTKNYYSALENSSAFPALERSPMTYAQSLKSKIAMRVMKPLQQEKPKMTPKSRAERPRRVQQKPAFYVEKPINPLAGPSYKLDFSHLQSELSQLRDADIQQLMTQMMSMATNFVKQLITQKTAAAATSTASTANPLKRNVLSDDEVEQQQSKEFRFDDDAFMQS